MVERDHRHEPRRAANETDIASTERGMAELREQMPASALRSSSMEDRISTLDAWQTWGVRIVLGMVITAVISLVPISTSGRL